jgi:hypothetical protein
MWIIIGPSWILPPYDVYRECREEGEAGVSDATI